jgi:Holliday junction resolvase-like predicted endonuclease
MEYKLFKQIFNETIFEKSKADLLEKIADNPSRYIGLFRPTKPKAKILQNLLQSHEIRFGDALEKVIEEYLKLKGCQIFPKKYTLDSGDSVEIDQCFKWKGKVYFIEQKVRDDHDSTKKRGQIENFEKKLDVMLSRYLEKELVGIFYFVDADLTKNRKYYTAELKKMAKDYGVETQIFYGKELFEYLKYADVWEETLNHLKKWREEIPDLPEINFDLEPQNTFEEIKDIKPSVFRKLLDNNEIFNEIVLTLFPRKETLKLLLDYFSENPKTIYKTITGKLKARLE